MSKLTAAQRKQVSAIVKAAKQSDGAVKWADLMAAETAAWQSTDESALPIAVAVQDELREWSRQAELEYSRLAEDVRRIEEEERTNRRAFMYLFDENVDQENVIGDGVTTTDSVDYWHRMCCAAGPAVGERSHSEGININARLGRCIY